eukprot:TRINITY_DN2181_c1_g2_i1.p1 TRINITY_DN2181_c1_g2~~TRINITY_DN2181_c1_g2_i1.p1  ORF type:complete len:500 (-),score=107.67 TRINITY_DN2181_c1_g2_i1:84-1583(-)
MFRRLLADGEGGEGGSSSASEATEDKTSLLFESMIVLFVLVVASIAFHTVSHWLQHAVSRSLIGPSFLQAVYRELSLLGMISFFLFVVSFSGGLSTHGKEVVEEIHMTLFIASVYYIAFIVFLLLSSVFWIRRMQKLEHKVANQKTERPKTTLWEKFKKWVSLRQVIVKSEYSQIRQAVIDQHQLPQEFNYSAYVGVQLQRNLLHIIEIDWKLWLATAFFFAFAIVVEEIKHSFTTVDALALYLVFNGVMAIFTSILIIKLRFVVRNLAKWKPVLIKPIGDTSYDRKVERTCGRQFQKGWCPCTQSPPHETAKNFWFSSRGLFRGLLQLVILFQAVNLAIFSLMSHEIAHHWSGVGVAVVILCTLFIVVIAIPYTVPVFALAASSGEYADRVLLRLLWQKQSEGRLSNNNLTNSGKWWKMNYDIFSGPHASEILRQPSGGGVSHDLEQPLLSTQYQPPTDSNPSPYTPASSFSSSSSSSSSAPSSYTSAHYDDRRNLFT